MTKITISVKVQIGKSSSGCAGFGVCSVTISADVNASLTYDNERNQMSLSLSKEAIKSEQPDKLVYFEGKTSVTFEEDFTFSDEVQRALKADHPLTIPPQKCPLESKEGNYIIQKILLKP